MTIVQDPDTILRQDIVDPEQLAVAMFDRYFAVLHFLAYSILRDPAAADDAVQETIIRALDGIHRYRIDTNMKAWLSTIVVNQCRTMLRRRKVEQRLQGGLRLLLGNRVSLRASEKKRQDEEMQQALWTAVDQLGEKHRLPIILRYVHGYSVREIAQLLNTREGTIHSRLHRACRLLRGKLAICGSEEMIREFLYE